MERNLNADPKANKLIDSKITGSSDRDLSDEFSEERPRAESKFGIYKELRGEVTYEANLAVSRTT